MMDAPKVSHMWDALQRANKLPSSGVVTGAETELQELMRQIDIMVHSRKSEWDKEKHGLLTRLDVREKELTMQQSTLENRHQEIGQLRSQLETAEQAQRVTAEQCEKQLGQLRDQVAAMKKEYEKLHKRYSRQVKEAKRGKSKVESAVEENQAEVQQLRSKLEEYRKLGREWDQEKRNYNRRLEGDQAQQRALEEKYTLSQHQTNDLESQISHRADLQQTSELSLKSLVVQLEQQLERSRDTIASHDSQNERLKSSLEEALDQNRKLMVEKDMKQAEPSAYRAVLAKMTGNPLNKTADTTTENMQFDPAVMMDQLQRLETELSKTRTQLNESEQTEESLQKQVRDLQHLLEIEQGQTSPHKTTGFMEMHRQEISSMKSDLSKMKTRIDIEQQTHEGQVEGMKKGMSAVTETLHDRTVAMAAMSEKMAALEKQAREHQELLDTWQAELQVAHAKVDTLKVENQQLRRQSLNVTGPGQMDPADPESSFHELQGHYSKLVTSLETQKHKMEENIAALKGQLSSVEVDCQSKVKHTLEQSKHTVEHIQQQELKKVAEVHKFSQQRIQQVEIKMASTVDQYENKISEMAAEIRRLQTNVDSQNSSLTNIPGLGLENHVMTNFVEGVDRMIQSSPSRGQSSATSSSGRKSVQSSGSDGPSLINQYGDVSFDLENEEEDFLADSAEAAVLKFRKEQEEQTRELERKLDIHIDNLRQQLESSPKPADPH